MNHEAENIPLPFVAQPQTRKNGGSVASKNDGVTFSCWAGKCVWAGHKTNVCLTKRPKLAEKWSGKQSQVYSPKVVKTNEHFP